MRINRYFGLFVITLALACGFTKSQSGTTDANGEAPSHASGADHARDGGSHDQAPHWSYTGDTGPEHWASLNPDWAVASEGKEQSPVNITGVIDENRPAIEFNYQPSRVNIINNGHTNSGNNRPVQPLHERTIAKSK